MEISKPHIPIEADADVAMSVIMPCVEQNTEGDVNHDFLFREPRDDKKNRHRGIAERTACGDALGMYIKNRAKSPSLVTFALMRESFYDILPEYLFHPIDCYQGISKDFAEFNRRYDEQVEQEKNALTYFHFFDCQYQELRVKLQTWLNEHIFKGNHFLSDFITGGIQFNRNNIFIMAVYPCLPWLRNHRGCRQMMETALEYAFVGNAKVNCCQVKKQIAFSDGIHSSVDKGCIDDLFCGDTFSAWTNVWQVTYQTPIGTETRLAELQKDIREFAEFFSTWFLAVEDILDVEFGDWEELPIITTQDSPTGIFLNYSTQLI